MTILNRIRKVRFSRVFVIYFVISQLIIILSNHQIFQEFAATPPGKVNLMVHRDWPQDYFGLLAYMTQGAKGEWLRYAPFETELTNPGFFHIVYVYIGKFGNIFPIPVHLSYHIFRLLAIEIFIVGLYAFSKIYLGERNAALGAYFGLLGTFGPEFLLPQKIQISWYPHGYPWWENLDSLERLYMPMHHVFGQGLMLWCLAVLFLWLRNHIIKLLLLVIVLFLIGALSFPPNIIPFGVAAVPAFVIVYIRQLLHKKPLQQTGKLLFTVVILCLLVLLIYLLQSWQERQGFPWNFTKPQEIARWNHEPSFDIAMPYVFGVLPLLAIPAFLHIFIKGKWQDVFIALWAIIPYILLPFADLLQFPKIRLVHENPYVPLAFLSVQTLAMLEHWVNGKTIARYLFVSLFLLSTIPVSIYHLYYRFLSIDYFLKNGDTRQYFISQDMYESFSFMYKNIAKKSAVISDFTTGSLIPGYTGAISFTGHQEAIDLDTKRFFSERFFRGEMNEREAMEFMNNYGIDYVYFGPYEKAYGQTQLGYRFLSQEYTNTEVILYKVQ